MVPGVTAMTSVSVPTRDGQVVAATCFEAAGGTRPRARVVIAPAMAVTQGFYQGFAGWLAGQGIEAWTFDYRGTGASWPRSMRGAPGTLGEWCREDYDAMLRHVAALEPACALVALGHSFGGQCAPLLPSRDLLAGLVDIAVGSGAMRHNTPAIRRKAPLLWYLLVPLLCPLFGYFPGARLGIIGDVPTGAMRQWRRWCLSPDYLLGAEPGARAAYASATYPVLALSFADDELLLSTGSDMIHGAYAPGNVDYTLVQPADAGLARIGHFGFFRAGAEGMLWPRVLAWIDARAADAAGAA
jgi:predicted alpha/beta hydrolase